MKKIEYKIRKVTRYCVTRYTEEKLDGASTEAGSELCGIFDHESEAQKVGFALAKMDFDQYSGTSRRGKAVVAFPDLPDGWEYYPER